MIKKKKRIESITVLQIGLGSGQRKLCFYKRLTADQFRRNDRIKKIYFAANNIINYSDTCHQWLLKPLDKRLLENRI